VDTIDQDDGFSRIETPGPLIPYSFPGEKAACPDFSVALSQGILDSDERTVTRHGRVQ
jgi:hypothetical protein